jgi:RHS repeat-associated protein
MLHKAFHLKVILILVLLSSVAYAGYEDEGNYPDLFCQPGRTAGSDPAFAGKPISLFSGMETFTPSADLTIGKVYPINITRSYNSKTSYDSPLGYGWGVNYDKRLYTYVGNSTSDSSVTVRRECGKKYLFRWQGPGFTSSADSGLLIQNPDGTYTYTAVSGEKEIYDAQGRLAGLMDTKGNSLVFTYSADTRDFLKGLLPFNLDQNTPLKVAYDYRLNKIEEKDATGARTGASVTFAYDTSTGRLNGIWDSIGRVVTYTHSPDGLGNLASVTVSSAAGLIASSTYGYTDPNNKHLLTSINEGNGLYENTYDTEGRVIKQTHGTGEIDFTYTIPYQKTTTTTLIKEGSGNLRNTQTRTVEFDTTGRVVKATDTFGNTTTYVRDSHTWILQEMHTDIATGITTTTAYTYDTIGNTLTRTDAQGTAIERTTTYTYDPTLNLVTTETVSSVVNAALVSVITNSYYPNGNLLYRTESGYLGAGTPYTYTTTYGYDGNGKLTSVDGPRTDAQDITTFAYDLSTGVTISMTQPIIGTTLYSDFDDLGNPQTVTDPNNNITTYTYDKIGRVKTVQAPGDANSTQYFYVTGGCQSCGGANKIDHITLPEGNTIHYHYDDGMGNLTSISDDAGNSINYTYDSEGNKLTEQLKDNAGSLQKTLSYSYDALNRLKRTTNPDATYTEYSYDFRGSRTAVRNPNGVSTTYSYDALSRLASVYSASTYTTSYGYNKSNNLTSVMDANNNTTQYKYDDKGRVYQVISPDTGTTTYTYDPAGNLTSKTANGVTVSYVYDALNRLTTIDFPSDTDIIYTYDTCLNGKGRLCRMDDQSGTTTYEYTPKGQVITETKTISTVAGNPYTTRYSYDQNGNLKTMTYPSGRVITYNYTNDKVINVQNNGAYIAGSVNTSISYKPFGGISAIPYGNGVTGSISYDNQYRITGITAGTVMNFSYPTYDANGNIKTINNALDATRNKTFEYDALDRLTGATGSWGSLGWTYDGVGNRQTEGATNYTYLPGTNKLNTVGGASYGFDNNGNTTAQGARQLIYNENQRLIRVVDAGVTKGEYTYNGNGQRVKKIVNGTATIFHYSPSGQIIGESDSAGIIITEYVYLNGQPLAKMEGMNTYYYHNDHLATPQKMTDSSGTVVWSADYKPFGEATVAISTITNNFRFPGQYYDAETGLHQNFFRDYNFSIGRYIESDPIGTKYGVNLLYAYVKNNPITYIDPKGLEQCRNRPNCYEVYINCLVNFLIAPGVSNVITATGDSAGYAATASAWNHAGSRTLTYPLRSSIVRGGLALGAELPLLGQLIALDAGLIYCLVEELDCVNNQ